jgi:cytochrome c
MALDGGLLTKRRNNRRFCPVKKICWLARTSIVYRENCAICHGTAGEPKTAFQMAFIFPLHNFLKAKA